jgi:hypothetical protein
MGENNHVMLHFDDDGHELRPGDKVRINMDEIRTIVEDKCGRYILEHWPEDEIIYNLELVWPPSRPPKEDDGSSEWPDDLSQ